MATATPFIPYWKPVGPTEGPNSWVFFAVAKITGLHRPVAVVSSVGDIQPEESIQGYSLIACCRHIVTIFTDPANHLAICAELALAAKYYSRDGHCEHFPEPAELPEFNRIQTPNKERRMPWNRARVHEFPFTATCLLQGVGFDAQLGRTQPVRPEPLATVYRDTSIEWGMVVVDITELDAVRYGIVGFAVSKASFVPSLEAERRPAAPGAMGPGVFERGKLRVMDELRPRRAMPAAEYMTKFNYETPAYGNAGEVLAQIPLVDAAAMSVVWPLHPEDDSYPPLSTTTTTITSIILEESHIVTSNKEHLSLEQLETLSAESISVVLEGPEASEIISISLCVDSIQSAPAQLIDVLSRADNLREIYLLQSPTRESDALSVQLFEELAARPQILSRANVMLAGAYSALCQKFWLPTVLKEPDAVQLAPLELFPVQQILVRHQLSSFRHVKFDYEYVYLGDGLLKPERFAAGFLLYLSTLMPEADDMFNSKAQLFSFSSAPSSLDADPLSSAEISPILAENLALPTWLPHSNVKYWLRMRDLVPGGWTVIVSQEMYRSSGSYYMRYAFIRPRQQGIVVDHPPLKLPSPEELEVVGLKEFLRATAPEVDPVLIDRRLHDVAKKLASGSPYWEPLPPDVNPLAVLSQPEAADILLEFLNDARKLKARLRDAMRESPEDRNWYPELLVEDS